MKHVLMALATLMFVAPAFAQEGGAAPAPGASAPAEQMAKPAKKAHKGKHKKNKKSAAASDAK